MTTLNRLEELIKQILEEQKLLGKDLQNSRDNINTAAAKIITDISEKIDKCECIEKLAKELKLQGKKPEEEITEVLEIPEKKKSPFGKYSFPNFNVGNEELGSSKNPGTLKWPFGSKKKTIDDK